MNSTKKIIIIFTFSLFCFGIARLFAIAIPSNGYSFPKSVFYEYSKVLNKKMKKTEVLFENKHISDVNLNSISSDIKVEQSLDDKIHLFIIGGEERLISSTVDQTLNIEIIEDDDNQFFINMGTEYDFYFSITSVQIILQLPKSIKRLEFTSTSGDIRLKNINLDNVNAKVVSGDISYDSDEINNANFETVSGDIALSSKKGPKTVLGKTVSGDIGISSSKLGLLNVYLRTVSGETFVSRFTEKFIIGDDGEFTWNLETVSGDIRI